MPAIASHSCGSRFGAAHKFPLVRLLLSHPPARCQASTHCDPKGVGRSNLRRRLFPLSAWGGFWMFAALQRHRSRPSSRDCRSSWACFQAFVCGIVIGHCADDRTCTAKTVLRKSKSSGSRRITFANSPYHSSSGRSLLHAPGQSLPDICCRSCPPRPFRETQTRWRTTLGIGLLA